MKLKKKNGVILRKRPRIFQINIFFSVSVVGVGKGSGKSGRGTVSATAQVLWPSSMPSSHAGAIGSRSLQFPLWVEEAKRQRRGRETKARQNSGFKV